MNQFMKFDLKWILDFTVGYFLKLSTKIDFSVHCKPKRDLAKSTKIQKIFFAPTIKELEKDLPDLEFIETLFNP